MPRVEQPPVREDPASPRQELRLQFSPSSVPRAVKMGHYQNPCLLSSLNSGAISKKQRAVWVMPRVDKIPPGLHSPLGLVGLRAPHASLFLCLSYFFLFQRRNTQHPQLKEERFI